MIGTALRRLRRLVDLAEAVATWPIFSRTSFRMISGLSAQGFRPQTVIDVGANEGQFTVAARNLLRPTAIHAFEPLEAANRALMRNTARYPEVAIHQIALAERESTSSLHVNRHSQSSSLLPLSNRHLRAFPNAREIGVESVRLARLDRILDYENLLRPVLLKIDTQGYERQVLDGATDLVSVIDSVIVETSFTIMYDGEWTFVDLVARMNDLGFAFSRPVGFLTDPQTGEFLQIDALFTRLRH